jgi:hypothetical protein
MRLAEVTPREEICFAHLGLFCAWLVKPSLQNKSDGAPGTIRTCDPMLRRHVLYPAELRARQGANYSKISHWSNGVTRYLKYSCVRMPNLFY